MKKSFPRFAAILLLLLASCDRENHFDLHQVGDNYVQHFSWWYGDKLYNMDLSFPTATYWHYRNKSKTLPYEDYATEDKGFEYLNYVASSLNALIAQDHLSDLEVTNFVLAFAQQSMPYVRDPIGLTGYPRYAIETLCDMGGDCKSKSALCCSVLLTFGIPSVLIQIPTHQFIGVACPNCEGHYCTYQNKKYFYGETTSPTWKLGDAPDITLISPAITVLSVNRTAYFDRSRQENRIAQPVQKQGRTQTGTQTQTQTQTITVVYVGN